MSYNLRLISSVLSGPGGADADQAQQRNDVEAQMVSPDPLGQEVHELLEGTTLPERQQLILPKIKKMSDYTLSKLNLTSEDDQKMIEVVRQKLQSIDQVELKRRIFEKGINEFALEQYMIKNNISFDNVVKNRSSILEKPQLEQMGIHKGIDTISPGK